ncbi:hypothetical protein B0H14DRAFT_2563180 [Mycena olivaceomarginata]|nr:hypothetical protein B0H14DRAFT_2563180 [Mycena olivaceomarginata]
MSWPSGPSLKLLNRSKGVVATDAVHFPHGTCPHRTAPKDNSTFLSNMHCPSICLMYLRSAYTTLSLFAAHIAQIQNRTPLSEIDSIQHILQDGTVISTQERVVNYWPLPQAADTGPNVYQAACNFRKWNKLLSIIHAHEAQDLGPQQRVSPSVITVFLAPNYLNMYNNKGAAIKYISAHPYILATDADGHTSDMRAMWSPPFVSEKITDMLIAVLNTCTTEECEEEEDVLMPETPTLLSSVSAGADAQRKAHW